ncbi:RIO1-domain-containing protein [Delitschia confertaspora ATCC 74209]|uniref:Serine/threonine-protein kinase RIO2 n=1 Tax=Delitschia confertaspora ATCC 74209 TaxID=1513339 RepID=A0A9P4MR02_9PLEO|nr:RIO1-domain-containing protein [Delitschia confertaspora ATCC 74209]
MKLNVKNIRYVSPEDWRVLTATEMGSRNHEIVPTPLIAQIASIRSGTGVHKSISALAKIGLIAKVKNAKYDGYRLTYGGLDYLALHTHTKSSTIYSVGNQIGVGKESDIYVCASPSGRNLVLKIHRLGRISFRTVKANRDYLRNRSSGSWMYMSRLAALKEYTFMQALRREGFPVPEPIAQSRHTVVMEMIDAFPLRQIASVPDPAGLYSELINMIVKLAQYGLIHGDFNEFNILVEEKHGEEGTPVTLIPTIIDFPQMLSVSHVNAEYYFDRDVACIKRFFSRRFAFTSDEPGPFLKESMKTMTKRLDVEVEATGFSKKMAKELEKYMKEVGVDGDATALERDGDEGEEDAEDVDPEENEPEDPDAPEENVKDADTAKPSTTSPADPSTLTTSMTVLDIQDTDIQDTDANALPSLEEIKQQTQSQQRKPTKSAKAKAGWSI